MNCFNAKRCSFCILCWIQKPFGSSNSTISSPFFHLLSSGYLPDDFVTTLYLRLGWCLFFGPKISMFIFRTLSQCKLRKGGKTAVLAFAPSWLPYGPWHSNSIKAKLTMVIIAPIFVIKFSSVQTEKPWSNAIFEWTKIFTSLQPCLAQTKDNRVRSYLMKGNRGVLYSARHDAAGWYFCGDNFTPTKFLSDSGAVTKFFKSALSQVRIIKFSKIENKCRK